MTALNLVTGTPWAILEPALKSIVEIADRVEPDAETIKQWKVDAVEAVNGAPSDRGAYTIRDGVAIVDVSGPIFRYANLFTQMSGATSLELLSKDFNAALTDPNVNGILLNVDSPGGQAEGIAEFADMVRGARAYKPVNAYIGGMGASAAYWIASAAETVTIAKTGLAGSIGVVATIRDTKAKDAADGVKTLKFVSSVSPNKQLDPDTDEGGAEVQAIVDRLAVEFVDSVANFRGVSVDTVLEKFGRGGVMVGTDAVRAGLVDAVGSFEGVLASMSPQSNPSKEGETMAENNSANVEASESQHFTVESVKADHPEIAAALIAEGANVERERIAGIEAFAIEGHEDLIASLKADGKTTPDQAAAKILTAEREKGKANMENIAAAVNTTADIESDAAGSETVKTDNSALPLEDRCKANWDSKPDLRAEFGDDFECYVAAAKAEERGTVNVLKQ